MDTSTTLPYWLNLGSYHPILLHFPIVFICTLFVLEVLYLMLRNETIKTVSFWFTLATFVTTGLTILTGWEAAKHYVGDGYLAFHRVLGFITFAVVAFYTLIKIVNRYMPRLYWQWISLFVSIALLILITLASDFGGVLVFTTTPFQKREPPSVEELLPSQSK